MTLSARDKKNIWHPFTQHKTSSSLLPLVRGEGAYVFDETGKRYLDLISSWWVNLHGHSHPLLAEAIYEQAKTLEHAIFAGFTHEPGIILAEELLSLLPHAFTKVFYSDNGSCAVEVALKMAFQYWLNIGKPRKRFIAFRHGYHGDTVGGMSVGKQSGFFTEFQPLLFPVDMLDYPETWHGDNNIDNKEQQVLHYLTHYLEQWGSDTAALIIEPLVQGVAGMRMCRAQFLVALETLLRRYGVLIIYDEVMTGFGRTGDLFACLKAKTTPDIICLAKGLTGGFLPLAATVCQEKIYQAFLGDQFKFALAHGHSFTANPLGCAAACASLHLLKQSATMKKIAMLEKVHQEILTNWSSELPIEKVRWSGTIAAFDLKVTSEYGSKKSLELRDQFANRGLLIRPLGNVIYFIPPYCVTETELREAYKIVEQEIVGVMA